MVLPVLKNFSVGVGVGFAYRFQWHQGVPDNAIPTDLTQYTGQMAVANYNNTVTYITLNSGVLTGVSGIFYGGDQRDPTNGIIDLIITGTDTAAFTFQSARYTLKMTPITNPTSPVWLMYGTMNVIGSLA